MKSKAIYHISRYFLVFLFQQAVSQESSIKFNDDVQKFICVNVASFTQDNTIEKVIDSCPGFKWHPKIWCGPVAVGNLFAHYDIQGYEDLFPGKILDAYPNVIYQWMSTKEHYDDYSLPLDNDGPPSIIKPDKSEPPIGDEHPDNCIADFLGTSFSCYRCPLGLTATFRMKPGIENYIRHFAPDYMGKCQEYSFEDFPWDSLVYNIDRDRPMIALVNMDNDNTWGDHWTLVVGYKITRTQKYYGCVNIEGSLAWFPYTRTYVDVTKEQWRIDDIFTFNIQKLPYQVGNISGPAEVCKGMTSVNYSFMSQDSFANYKWTLPSGATGNSDSSSILIDFAESAGTGTILVYGFDNHGKSRTNMFHVSIKLPPDMPDTIFGPSRVCTGQTEIFYEVPEVAGATEYVWSLPEGTRGAPLGNQFILDIYVGARSGIMSVRGKNKCGLGQPYSLSIEINEFPATPEITHKGHTLHSSAADGNQWFLNDSLLVGANQQDLDLLTDGNYFSMVTLNGCTSEPSNIIDIHNSGIDQLTRDDQSLLFPNPTTGVFTVNFPSQTSKIQIYSMEGSLLQEILNPDKIRSFKCFISESGIYFIRIIVDHKVLTQKVVINQN